MRKELQDDMFAEYENNVTDDVVKAEYKSLYAWGEEVLINLYDCDLEKMLDEKYIRKFVADLVKEIDMKAFGEPIVERFGEGELYGYSVVQLIYTSCITMHFSEVDGRIFIDIFSCKEFGPKMATDFCAAAFGARVAKHKTILRD